MGGRGGGGSLLTFVFIIQICSQGDPSAGEEGRGDCGKACGQCDFASLPPDCWGQPG